MDRTVEQTMGKTAYEAYIAHPGSGYTIEGFLKVPWEELVEAEQKAWCDAVKDSIYYLISQMNFPKSILKTQGEDDGWDS